MFVRVVCGFAAILLASACVAPQPRAQTETVSDGSAWQPYPGASKDAAFLKKAPAAYRPFVEACNPWDDWDKPGPPFKVFGNTYYVGTCGIAAILITGDDGHILIDTGTEAGADVVLANITALGFDPANVQMLLHSHEHFDHTGGFAKVQDRTAATIIASPPAAPVIATGILARDDPQYGLHDAMTPALVSATVETGQTVRSANTVVTAIETPGHSPGALSWQWTSCEGERCLNMVYADSLSPISSDDYKFADHPDYVREYFDGLERLGRLDCDILLTPHPSHSRMLKRMHSDTMIEPTACAYYAIGKARDLEKRLIREKEEAE